METSLVLVNRDGSQREVPLKKARVIIGRQADATMRLPDPNVSRQHCELQLDAGRPVLKDLGSSNGTYVNRRRISQTELSAGDTVSIGPFLFVVKIDGEPGKIDSEEVLEDAVAVGTAAPTQAPAPKPAAKSAAKPAPRPESLPTREPPTRTPDPDDSDEFNFDFLDEKDEPKL
ncbi:MAG: FHA domain-containing protein [Phycisphaerales bacterium]|nr:FHA domain-containing protein [Phycisphaerales bacterium]